MQAMHSALAALKAELGTELLSQLDSGDQREVSTEILHGSKGATGYYLRLFAKPAV